MLKLVAVEPFQSYCEFSGVQGTDNGYWGSVMARLSGLSI